MPEEQQDEMRYTIQMLREHSEEMKQEHPNLAKSPIRYPLAHFALTFDMDEELNEKEIKQAAEKILKKKGVPKPDEREYEKKEDCAIQAQNKKNPVETENPVWEGELKIPEQYWKEELKEKSKNTTRGASYSKSSKQNKSDDWGDLRA